VFYIFFYLYDRIWTYLGLPPKRGSETAVGALVRQIDSICWETIVYRLVADFSSMRLSYLACVQKHSSSINNVIYKPVKATTDLSRCTDAP
jgi:hypothetical protein